MASPKALVAVLILVSLLVGTIGFSLLSVERPLFPLEGASAALGVGPVGPQGPKGDTGLTGAQGPQGIQGGISGSGAAATQTLPYSNIINTPSGQQPYSFLIRVNPLNSSQYQAINGTDNQVINGWSSTNGSYVTSLASQTAGIGGSVYINGAITLDSPVIARSRITGSGCVYNRTDNTFHGSYFSLHTGLIAIETPASSVFGSNLEIDHIGINLERRANTIGVFWQASSWGNFHNNIIAYGDPANSTAFWISGVGAGAFDSKITNNYVSDVKVGIQQDGTNNDEWTVASNQFDGRISEPTSIAMNMQNGLWQISGNTVLNWGSGLILANSKRNSVTGNTFDECAYGVTLGYGSAGDANDISHNWFVWASSNALSAIVINGVKSSTVESNHIETLSPRTMYQAIIVNGGAYNNTIDHNTLIVAGIGIFLDTDAISNNIEQNDLTLVTGSKLSDTGIQTHIYDNKGYTSQWDISQCSYVTVGENVAAGDVLYHSSTGYFKANAVSSAKLPTYGIYGVATQTITSGNLCLVVTSGQYNGFSGLNVNLPMWVSNSTAGGWMQTYPANSGAQAEIFAQPLSATSALINPKSVISIP